MRLSWAKGRLAKRPEDTVYSLLGIFDIQMPLIYGEGRRKAFIRLRREIEQSSTAPGSTQMMGKTRVVRPTHPYLSNCGSGFQFNAHGGIQNNNTGSGSQFFGSFSGPVNFG